MFVLVQVRVLPGSFVNFRTHVKAILPFTCVDRGSSIPFAYFPLEMHMGHSQTPNSKINNKYTFDTNGMHIHSISEVHFGIRIGLMALNL